MKPELLVAWIETEGWFRIRIDPSDHYIGVSVAISQSNFETLEKIRKEVGFGRTDFSRGEGKLCFDRQEDIPKIISILDSVKERDWYTPKFKDYQIWKNVWNFLGKRRNKRTWKFWTKDELEFILKERAKMKYQKVNGRKYKDSEIMNLWFNYQERSR
jgi:hypothetical protein